jgi:FlaG/FlaF family flagellin (archaellin)
LRAISPVLAVLMMIAVAIAGSLVVYAWVMGYIGLSTERSGEAIMIQSIANKDKDLLVFVQNVGEGVVQLDQETCLYVNDILVSCIISGVTVSDNIATQNKGETATLTHVNGAALPGEKVTVKVTTLFGTFIEKFAYPGGSARPTPVLDHFEFYHIASPQTSDVDFTVTVRAIDQYGKQFTDYDGFNGLSFSGGEITPSMTTNGFVDGFWSDVVSVSGSADEATITTVAQSSPLCSGTSNAFEVVEPLPPEQLIFFEEDFESYQVDTFPYSGGWDLWYSGMGGAYQVIVDSVSNSPTKSLQLLGSHSTNWAAYAAKPIATDSPLIGFNASVRVESLGDGNRDIARLGFATLVPPVYVTTYAPILFTDFGTIKVKGEGDLQSYVADRWYKVTVIMDRNAESYSLWIDDVLVGENLTVMTNKGPMTAEETPWKIEAFGVSQNYHSATVYFDDVTVFYVP